MSFGYIGEVPMKPGLVRDGFVSAGDLGSLDDLSAMDGTGLHRQAVVDDTIERQRPPQKSVAGQHDEAEDEDLLSATGILKEQTGILRGLEQQDLAEEDQSGDSTGILPTIEAPRLGGGKVTEVDFAIGEEAATMSEVGTKLDLARAYIDMGDPEGARSILDEVLQEGSSTQRQEAERLIASLP